VKLVEAAEDYFRTNAAVEDQTSMVGVEMLTGFTPSTSAAVMFISLKPFEERLAAGLTAQKVVADASAHFMTRGDGLVLCMTPPAIQGLGQRAGFQLELQDRGGRASTP
jgi:multidrug efflux pump subunit AcrB